MPSRPSSPFRVGSTPAWVLGIVAAAAVLLAPCVATAKTVRVHGVVLAVQPKTGEVIVRHDAFDGMPGMTMPFKVSPPSRIGELQAGSEINATLDTSHDPWTLSNIAITATQTMTAALPVRNVKPVRIGDLVPDTEFVTAENTPFRFSSVRGADVVLSFIYTRCRDPRMCPLISAKFNQLQHKIGARDVHLVEVSLDPSYDRPNVLKRYGQTFNADPKRWTLAVADVNPTLDFAAQFGVTAFPDPNTGLIHSENTVLIGPDGRVRSMIVDNDWQPDELIADIDASHGEAANPIARFNLWLTKEAVALCGNSAAGFSGLSDLLIVLVIFGAGGYLMFRLIRVFAKNA